MTTVVNVVRERNIAIVTINNPPFNVLGSKVVSELMDAFETIQNDKEVIVVLLTGAGDKAFMAGADIKEFPSWLGQTEMIKSVKKNHELYNLIDCFPKPTIALLNGITLGGGCELALTCDLRITEDHVKIGLPEINLGIFPGGGGTQRLPKIVGIPKAKELMYLGETISAHEALQIGLVNKVVEKGQGLIVAKELAHKVSKKSLNALSSIKESIEYGYEHTFPEGIKRETQLFYEAFQHEDAIEGIHAFIEKRSPSFNRTK